MSFKNGKNSALLGGVSGSVELSITNNTNFRVTLAGAVTFSFAGSTPDSEYSISILIQQDGTGSRTVSWPGNVVWPADSPVALSVAANAVDLVSLQTFDSGATWYGVLIGNSFS
jgi:hypothetical protein